MRDPSTSSRTLPALRLLTRRTALIGGLLGCASPALARRPRLLHRDRFVSGIAQWKIELERAGRVTAANGVLDIDVPAGATVWFRPVLEGPVAIDYTVIPVAEGGANDAVSDVNCFWMAHDPAVPAGDALAIPRSGAFADYDRLATYYAGIGGNRNSSSRFRRYVAKAGIRPLLPQHDLSAPRDLLVPNQPLRIRLIADGRHIALHRDGRAMFTLDDPAPYRRGHFGFRTTQSHLRVLDFKVWRL